MIESTGDEPTATGGPAAGDDGPTVAEAQLLTALTRVLGTDRIADGLLERATALVDVLDLEAGLARLLEEEPVGVRSTGTAGRLAFESADGGIMLEVAVSAGEPAGYRLAGSVLAGLDQEEGGPETGPEDSTPGTATPGAAAPGATGLVNDSARAADTDTDADAAVLLERTDAIEATTTVDELGQFSFDGVSAGRLRLRLPRTAQGLFVTDWFVL